MTPILKGTAARLGLSHAVLILPCLYLALGCVAWARWWMSETAPLATGMVLGGCIGWAVGAIGQHLLELVRSRRV